MSRPVPSARLLRALKASIEGRQLPCSFHHPRRSHNASRIPYSTIAPVTAVNTQKTIPEEYQSLHQGLKALGKAAAVYVNDGQLKLAIKDLETRHSTTRIAVLGVNDSSSARRLLHTLLVDPLSPEASWEKELQDIPNDAKPLLIRSGLKKAVDISHPLVRTIYIPSKILEEQKIEIFLSQIEYESGNVGTLSDAGLATLLSTSLHAQQSFSGRTTSVTYPVHRTIILDSGFKSILGLANLLQSTEGKTATKMIKILSDLDWQQLPGSQFNINFINLAKAQHAVQALRQSLQNSTTYEHEWLNSGIIDITPLILPRNSESEILKPTVRDLINHILEETDLALLTAEAQAKEYVTGRAALSDESRKDLQDAISNWAEEAHKDLGVGLGNIVDSKQWRKLAWYKLLWRVDEVELIVSDATRRSYLVEAEKSLFFLAGRVAQVGCFDATIERIATDSNPTTRAQQLDERDEPLESYDGSPLPSSQQSKINHKPHFLSQLSASRLNILQEKNLTLAAAAQRYLLSFLSLAGAASLTSALAYASVASAGLYETGSIAALGIVVGAYRLQSKWELAKDAWCGHVFTEGKRALDAMEQQCRRAVETGGLPMADDASKEEIQEARQAVVNVRQELSMIAKESTVNKIPL